MPAVAPRHHSQLTVRPGLTLRCLLFLAVCVLSVACSGSRRSAVQSGGGQPLLVVAVERGDTSEIQLVAPSDGRPRRRIALVAHRPGWGVRASVTPDGGGVAYTVLPRDAADADTQAELWLLPLAGGRARRLASGVDLRSELVWSPDGGWVSYDRVDGRQIQLRRVNVAGAGDVQLAGSGDSDRWFLMGYSADGGRVSLAHITADGTSVVEASPGVPPAAGVAELPHAARDFGVAPDGRPAMLALEDAGGRRSYRAVVRADDGAFVRLSAGGSEDTGVAWNPHTGVASVGVVPLAPGGAVGMSDGAIAVVPATGFDVPVAWSPDGGLLALRHFSGASTDQPGVETVVILDRERRQNVTSDGPLAIAGWTTSRRYNRTP